MRLAQARAGNGPFDSITYFGDGPWDQKAAEALGYNFVSVGNRISSPQSIRDYTKADAAFEYIYQRVRRQTDRLSTPSSN